jgi:hypothetical protein
VGYVQKIVFPALFAICLVAPQFDARASTVFDFKFDDQGLVDNDGPLVGAVVGSGRFTSPIDLASGTYNLSSLTGFSVAFSFINGDSFTTTDITTPLTGVAVKITDFGVGRQRLFFTEGSGPGVIHGSKGGALDLENSSNYLSFEPSFAGGNFLYLMRDPGFDGRYIALSADVPEPAINALMGLGIFGILASRRKAFNHKRT